MEKRQIDTRIKTIVDALFDKKAEKIVSIDLRHLNNRITDFFVICNGNSEPHIESLAKNVEDQLRLNCNDKPLVREGYENKEWILLDYFDIIVHIFNEEKRDFFGLENLWADGKTINYNDQENNLSN